MRLYTVHIRRNSEAPDHEAILVRDGFSWGAFLFTLPWALWRRMWLGAFLILLGALLIIPTSVAAAPFGVRLAHGISRRTLELAFALFLLTVGLRFLLSLVG